MTDSERNFLKAENEQLKKEIDYVKGELNETNYLWQATKSELEILKKDNVELLNRIKFYEGQIEAYQYCMNCRR